MSFNKLLMDGMLGFHQPVDRTKLENGIIVSTVNTADQGLETAIIDQRGAHPVERYRSQEEATQGHTNWVEHARAMKTGDKMIELGYDNLLDSFEFIIQL